MEVERVNINSNSEEFERSAYQKNDFFFNNEDLNDIFEKDARRYKRYLGEDILKEQLL